MKDATLFTKFDIRWGYNNIHIHEEDQWKAAFITSLGLFEPTVMFFGFCNASSTFQAFMNHIGIHTKDDLALHHEWTCCVLLHLKEHGLSLKISKCIFNAPQMEFLGMIIGQGKVEMDPKKLDAIRSWKPPTSIKAIQSFTGFANFY